MSRSPDDILVWATGKTPKRNLELAQEVDPNNAEVFEAFSLVYQSTAGF